MKIKTAVVGVGYLGRFHAQKHKALNTLSFVCDVSKERAQSIAQELGCEFVTDPEKLIGKIQAVTIAANTEWHFDLCQLFLSHGVHVFVEKPICSSVSQSQILVELAKQNGLKLAVGHVERFNPAYAAARSSISHPTFVSAHRHAPFKPRSLGIDVVLDLMIHDIDLVLDLAQSPVKEIFSRGIKVITPLLDACEAWLNFENGMRAHLSSSRVGSLTKRELRVFEKSQITEIDLAQSQVSCAMLNTEVAGSSDKSPLIIKSLEVIKWDAMQKETETFFQEVERSLSGSGFDETTKTVDGRAGHEALRVAEKIIEYSGS